ncbi:hypothetical protein SELMODRAFT_417343 [Selaginella moellendorffii]|uniref:Uncharacterized protein n=1 Tax=Selaginella moellendorffii TaxID=88036 RepID=D8S1X4_SELML|nr:hypothetical protein SELMODRAFT_417343 [Selaginella moellendorffii]
MWEASWLASLWSSQRPQKESQESSSDDDAATVREVHSGEALSSVGDELPEIENVDDLQTYSPRLLVSGDLLPRSTTPASQLSLAVAIVLVAAHGFFRVTRHRQRSRIGSLRISRTQPLPVRSPRPTAASSPTTRAAKASILRDGDADRWRAAWSPRRKAPPRTVASRLTSAWSSKRDQTKSSPRSLQFDAPAAFQTS